MWCLLASALLLFPAPVKTKNNRYEAVTHLYGVSLTDHRTGEAINLEVSAQVVDLAFTPDDEKLAIATEDGYITFHKTKSGDEDATFEVKSAHKEKLTNIEFGPDSNTLVVAFERETRLYRYRSVRGYNSIKAYLKKRQVWQLDAMFTQRGNVKSIAVSPDSRGFATLAQDGSALVVMVCYQPATAERKWRRYYYDPQGKPVQLHFSADNRSVIGKVNDMESFTWVLGESEEYQPPKPFISLLPAKK